MTTLPVVATVAIRLEAAGWGMLAAYAAALVALGLYKFCSSSLPIPNADNLGNFRMGPLEEFGEKTPLWHSLRRVNRTVKSLVSALLKLRSDDVYHIGREPVPNRNHGLSDRSLVKNVSGDEVVNRSLTRSVFCRPELDVAEKGLEYVSPVTGEVKPYPGVHYDLAPGQGVLLRLVP